MTSISLDRTVHRVTSFIRFNIHQVDPMYIYSVAELVRMPRKNERKKGKKENR